MKKFSKFIFAIIIFVSVYMVVKYFGSNVVMVLYNNGNASDYSIHEPVSKYEAVRSIDELKYAIDRMQYNLQEEMLIVSSDLDLSNFSVEEYMKKQKNITKVNITYSVNYLQIKPEYSLWYQVSQLDQLEELKKDASREALELYEIAQDIIQDIIHDQMTDYEKEKAIHDYLVLNTRYGTESGDHAYTIAGVLKDKVAVCQGYAETFKLFMDLLDIESYLVVGVSTEDHEWNMVKIDGEYYHVDVTWDDPTPDVEGEVSYLYFNVTDEMIGKDHTWNDKSLPPCDAIDANYYYRENLWVHSISELMNRVLQDYKKNQFTYEYYCDFETDQNLSNFVVNLITKQGYYGNIKYVEKENYVKVMLNSD